jgi:hypothetical protein
VLDQRIDKTASNLISGGPDAVAGRCGDVVEDAALDNRGGDDAPARPVEVRGERLLREIELSTVHRSWSVIAAVAEKDALLNCATVWELVEVGVAAGSAPP